MKNKTILPLFIFCLLSANLLAQNFWVPDSVFRNKLKLLHPTCFTPQDSMIISCVSNVTSLDINHLNISSLDGIQFFTSLNYLKCTYLNLTTLPPLPNSLHYLQCFNNNLTSLPPLPPSLESLTCNGNNLTTLPTLPNSLTSLMCVGNLGLIIPALPNALITLDCSICNLSTLPVLPNSLNRLYCYGNHLTSLPNLPSSLTILQCINNNLDSLSPLPNTLIELYCAENNLTLLPALPNSLKILNCSKNHLTNLPLLPNFLEQLNCSRCSLSSLPSLPASIAYMDCSYNNLHNLPTLSNSLISFSCSNNKLLNLPLIPNYCIHFDCSNNSLTKLPILPSNLSRLYCSNNPLSCLPVLPSGLDILDVANTYLQCLANIPSGIASTNILPLCAFNSRSCYYAYTYGFVFIDSNSNGVKDSSETGAEIAVHYGNNYMVLPDSNGFFDATSDTGANNFEVIVPQYYIATTPTSQTVQASSNSQDTLLFGMQPIPNINDLRIDLTPFNFLRPGFKTCYGLYYRNIGTTTISNIQIKYLNPSWLTVISATPPATGFIGDTLTWIIGQLQPYQSGMVIIFDSISALAPLNSLVDAQVWVLPSIGDTTPTNNYSSCHDIIVGSCDPNDKSVTPEFISPAQNDYLEYVIRFQNTGTDTAFSVLITDTLSMDLDVASIQLISSSHSCNFWVEHGIAKWYFANILLPDSNVNESASHGFVKFKILPKSNLTIGAQIPNSANIYFDYNAAVITNTIVVNVTPMSVKTSSDDFKLAVFPNPVHQTVHLVSTNNTPLGKLELVNIAGKIIESKTIKTTSYDWQVESLPDGVYLFKGENWQEKIVKK